MFGKCNCILLEHDCLVDVNVLFQANETGFEQCAEILKGSRIARAIGRSEVNSLLFEKDSFIELCNLT